MASPGSLVAQAAVSGYDEARARKQQLSDEERRLKAEPLINTAQAIIAKLPNLSGQELDDAKQQLVNTQQTFDELYHPIKAPGAMQKDVHWLVGKIHGVVGPKDKTPASITTTTPAITLPNGTTLPAGPSVTVTKAPPVPWGQVQVLKQQAADRQKAQQEASVLEAGAPLSTDQQAAEKARADATGTLEFIKQAARGFDQLFPNAPPQERDAFLSSLVQKNYGFAGHGSWSIIKGKMNGQEVSLLFDKFSHQVTGLDGQPIPSELLYTFVPDEKAPTANDQALSDYDKAKNAGYKGSFEQWKVEEAQKGRAAAPTNRDDKYIAIEQKKAQGIPLTSDEAAYDAAYNIYIQKTKVDPGVARAAAFGSMRYVPIIDPDNPENTILMRAGDAAAAKAGTPQSIGYQTDKAVTRYMTSGQGGTNINYFNTAMSHLRLLKQAGDALHNGQIQRFNQMANDFSTATGNPSPTNFDAIKGAVAGELSKTFKGTGATDEEISEINQTINNAQSPEQIQGAINYYIRLMQGKMDALKGQYESGKQGRPDFTGGGVSTTNTPKLHKIKIGNKYYIYNGSGDTADLKNYKEVSK